MNPSGTAALHIENRRLQAQLAALRQERLEADALHAADQAHYRGLLGSLNSGFCLIHVRFAEDGHAQDYRFLETNAAFERHTGLHDASGRWMRDLAPQHEQHWFDMYGQIVRSGEARRFVDHAHALNRWYEVHATRVGAVELAQVAVLFTDITARRLTEQALRLSDRLLALTEPEAMAFEAARTIGSLLGIDRAGYCEVDIETASLHVRNDWYVEDLLSLAGEHRLPELGAFFQRLLAGEPVIVEDVRADPRITAVQRLLDDGVVSFVSFPLVEGQRTVAVMYLACRRQRIWTAEQLQFVREVAGRTRNALERRRAENQLRALNASLEDLVQARSAELLRSEELLRQSQKMEAVGQLTGGIAHDFNNLLAGISGCLELLRARVQQGRLAELDRHLDAAEGASRRAAALTHRLLAFSRRQTLDPQPTDLNQLVAGMQELIGRTMGPAVATRVAPETVLWSTQVDPHQLENALLNLCINARDAMPEGGEVCIATHNCTLGMQEAGPLQLEVGDYVMLSVTDNGIGMAADVLAKAFDPFFTTKPLGMGTGLGLSMIYGFARQSGGMAWIESHPGQGTCVRLYLPRCHTLAVQSPSGAVGASTPVASGGTVLVVDDEPTVRALVVDILTDLGCTLVEAAEGTAGLQLLRSNLQVDLLVTDIGLPGGLNGRQFADAARQLRPNLKVLFITGYAEQAVLGAGELADGMHIMTKPFSVEALGQRVTRLLEGERAPAREPGGKRSER
ncbi:ATP-binding protein [Pseudomonas typographi]|uniref:ATP-binding protein n=1 Tax=Pseudomonas typographi TaxID=2715964 RepID=UPI001688836D|nr:ATP-binding protein [Pseudomonas typographi]MBD1587061.1 response regulator [Pseudomonas typographi]